jgi:hypothetical protein
VVGHIGKDLEGVGYDVFKVVFRYLSGGSGEDHETLMTADHPAEIRPVRHVVLR